MASGEAKASKLSFSTLAHWWKMAVAFMSVGSGKSLMPWVAYLDAM